jgi:hypothetical protein
MKQTQTIIVLMMEEASTSETSVNFYETRRRRIPEDSHLHDSRRENLKSHQQFLSFHYLFIHPFLSCFSSVS